jgi:dTDP-glucose pyrophosphorylase
MIIILVGSGSMEKRSKTMQIVIPMAGAGKRFTNAGYKDPKPFIPIKEKPMIQWVIENLYFPMYDVTFNFIVQQDHREKYDFDSKIYSIIKNCYDTETADRTNIIGINYITEGAACTVLKARGIINTAQSLLIANSDQFIDWHIPLFIQGINRTDADGCIPVFHATHPKWSFAELDEIGNVVRVREKEPISTYATVGIYWFKCGEDFVWAADEMINKNLRVNNEFYVCPTYNELIIPRNKKILTFPIPTFAMHGLGTPEDLEEFKKLYQN